MGYRVFSVLVLVLVVVGCSVRLSFDELIQDTPSKVSIHNYSSEHLKYRISIPNTFELDQVEYDESLVYETFIDTLTEFEEGANALLMFRYPNSKQITLTEAWDEILSNREKFKDFQIYSTGQTDYLSEPAYYEHSSCVIGEDNMESITFLFSGDSSSFYLMTLQGNNEEGYPDNIKKLLYCAKTMKVLP